MNRSCPLSGSAFDRTKSAFDRTSLSALAPYWGQSLCGPIVFADQASREAVANRTDAQGALEPHQGVFVGNFPPDLPLANTGLEWNGTRWSMLVWPVPGDKADRLALMAHESFHRIQPALGFEPKGSRNEHLNVLHGRYWLRLEMRALDRALSLRGSARDRAIEDALLFRAKRREPFAQAAEDEAALEANEGLAQYTGAAIGAAAAGLRPRDRARTDLAGVERRPSLVRSFAYGTGPAYGVLLDEARARGWRRRALRGEGLERLLASARRIRTPPLANAERRATIYDPTQQVGREERQQEIAQLARLADFRTRLIDGPLVIVPISGLHGTMNPNRVFPIGVEGTVFETYEISGSWGSLRVRDIVLVPADGETARLPGPATREGNLLTGPGWQIDLAPGWELTPSVRAGDVMLTQASRP